MIFHDYYSEIPREEIDRFIATQEMGRLVTVSEDGTPHVGLYNFVYAPPAIELHLVRADEQVADLKVRPRCAFEVDEVLAVIPSHWVHPEYAGSATAYHRTVIFECAGTVAEDPTVVMAQQQRLLAKHQPEGQYRPLNVDDPLYKGALNQLAAVTSASPPAAPSSSSARTGRWRRGRASSRSCAGGTAPATPAPPTPSSGLSITPSRQEPDGR